MATFLFRNDFALAFFLFSFVKIPAWDNLHDALSSGAFDVVVLDEREAVFRYRPAIVLCSWMPFGQDWTGTLLKVNS